MLKILFLLVSVNISGLSINDQISQLEKSLETATDTARVSILNELCIKYQVRDPAKSLEYGFMGIAEATRIDDQTRLAYLHNNLGITYVYQANYDKASKYHLEALRMFRELDNERGEAKAIFDMAYMYKVFQNEMDTAINYYKKALSIFEKLGEKKFKVNSLNGLGIAYTENKQLDLGHEYFMKMLSAAREYQFEDFEATALLQLGWHFINRKDYETAKTWYFKAGEYEKGRNNDEGYASSLNSLSYIYMKEGKLDKALQVNKESIDIYKASGNKFKLARAYRGCSRILMESRSFYEAIECAKLGLKVSKEMEQQYMISYFYKFLHQCSDSLSLIENSFDYYKKYMAVYQDIRSKERVEKIAEIRSSFDLDLKNKDLSIQNEKIKYEKRQKYWLVAIILLIGLLSILFIWKQRVSLKLKAANEKLQLIQINQMKSMNQELEKELSFKNRELMSFSLNFVRKNNLFSEITEDLKGTNLKSEDSMRMTFQRIRNKAGFNKKINKDWDQFKTSFEQIHPGFFEYLIRHFPKLTPNELRICALAKLNLSSKEMVAINDMTLNSLKIARYRIRKKLGMKSEQGFNEFFILIGGERAFEKTSQKSPGNNCYPD